MAQIKVETTEQEQEAVLKVLRECNGETVPVAQIATMAHIKASRARYALADLIESGRVKRTATKAFNKHYCRYSYEVL